MKEYFENRISQLKSEYSELLTEIGNKSDLTDKDEDNFEKWKKVEGLKAKLDEVKEIQKYYLENKYTEL